MRFKELIIQISLILFFSFVIGISVNWSLIKQYRKGDFNLSFISAEDFPAIRFIGVLEAEDLFVGGNAVFLDSRAEEKYTEGHILGAVNIPFEGDGHIDEEQVPFEHHTTLIVYCDGNECQSSVHLAKVLAEFGFEDIRVFFGGWADWVDAGLPLAEKNDS